MSRESEFLIYCMERYRYHKKLSGKQVRDLFNDKAVLDYIISNYGALHTVGEEYLIIDIDEFIDNQKNN